MVNSRAGMIVMHLSLCPGVLCRVTVGFRPLLGTIRDRACEESCSGDIVRTTQSDTRSNTKFNGPHARHQIPRNNTFPVCENIEEARRPVRWRACLRGPRR